MYVNIAVHIYFFMISPIAVGLMVCVYGRCTLWVSKKHAWHTGHLSVYYVYIELHVNVSVTGFIMNLYSYTCMCLHMPFSISYLQLPRRTALS